MITAGALLARLDGRREPLTLDGLARLGYVPALPHRTVEEAGRGAHGALDHRDTSTAAPAPRSTFRGIMASGRRPAGILGRRHPG
jgi:hypothetical protein